MTLFIMAFGIMTITITTLCTMTFSIMTFIITPLSIKAIIILKFGKMTLDISKKCHYAECR